MNLLHADFVRTDLEESVHVGINFRSYMHILPAAFGRDLQQPSP
jgi:hypothetical protein